MPCSSTTELSSVALWEDPFNEHVFTHLENGECEIIHCNETYKMKPKSLKKQKLQVPRH